MSDPHPSTASRPAGTQPAASAVATLLARLEELSRARPDRVLRLSGTLPAAPAGAEAGGGAEPFELLIFRGFSSSTTHPTAFDPDRPALPEGSRIDDAELLEAPLDPAGGVRVAGPAPVATFLDSSAW